MRKKYGRLFKSLCHFFGYYAILFGDDPENCVPARNGFVQFAQNCISRGIVLVTSSDNGTDLVKIDLRASGIPLELFADHFRMENGQPKNFWPILERFKIDPRDLFVFGDRFDLDIDPAMRQGCRALLIPPYDSLQDSFDWMSVMHFVTEPVGYSSEPV
jgi:FMN phosphatase YigB (HAD superfamily)